MLTHSQALHTYVCTQISALSQPLSHTVARSSAETPGVAERETSTLRGRRLLKGRDLKVRRQGGKSRRVLPPRWVQLSAPHTELGPPGSELLLLYAWPKPGPWGHGGWGGTEECAWHVLTGDFLLQLCRKEPLGQRPEAGDAGGCLGEVTV